MTYAGSCHCGRITFEVDGDLTAVVACNCSICSRKGALLWCVPHERLRLLSSDDGIGRYTFNNHAIQHRFCPTCGMHPYAEDAASAAERMAYINARCLENVDPTTIPIQTFDGRSM